MDLSKRETKIRGTRYFFVSKFKALRISESQTALSFQHTFHSVHRNYSIFHHLAWPPQDTIEKMSVIIAAQSKGPVQKNGTL